MRRVGLVVLWVAASFATALVAWSVVGLAGEQVADAPVRPLSADEVAALTPPTTATTLPPTTTAPASADPPAAASIPTTSSPVSAPSSSVAAAPGRTSTSAPSAAASPASAPTSSSTSSTTTTAPASATSTTAAPVSSTTTTAPAQPEVLAYQLTGGTVVISASPGRVVLTSATPRAGFTMEVKDDGPDEVRVEFEGEPDSKFRARWQGGVLDVDIDG